MNITLKLCQPHTKRAAIAITVLFLLVGCGAPAVISVRNITDATAGPSNLTQPPNNLTGGADMPGMDMPTQPAVAPVTQVASAAQPTSSGTDYVLIWILFGTPTPTQHLTQSSSDVQVTTAGTVVSAATTATQVIAAVASATRLSPTTVAASAVAQDSGVGNPIDGHTIFTSQGGCTACHDTSAGNTIVGPSLKGVANRAGNRKPGMSASDYLRESIKSPNAFVVPGFPANIMPQTFNQMLTAQQIDDLVAYLLTLN